MFPSIEPTPEDLLLLRIDRSRRRWVVIVDQGGLPHGSWSVRATLIRGGLFELERFNPSPTLSSPIILRDGTCQLDDLMRRFEVKLAEPRDDPLEEDVILLWIDHSRVLTLRYSRPLATRHRGAIGVRPLP